MIGRLRTWLAASLVIAAVLGLRQSGATPNIYSSHSGTADEAKLTVTAPSSGKREAGDTILIAWKKKTQGKLVSVALYTATASGGRGDKVYDIRASAQDQGSWSSAGGSFRWKLPEQLSSGRYVVVVRSEDFVATSDAFSVAKPDHAAKAGPVKLGPDGIVTKADISDRGAAGYVLLKSAQGETRYDWGSGLCERLEGGLPGALATMAALGQAEITPRLREVTEQSAVKQRCIVGLVSKNKVVAPES